MADYAMRPYVPDLYQRNSKLADLLLQSGQQQAEGLRNAGQIEAQKWAGIGNAIQQGAQGYVKQQAEEPRRQLEALQVQGATQAMSDDQLFRSALAQSGGDLSKAADILKSKGAAGIAALQKLGPIVEAQQEQHNEKAGEIGYRILKSGATPDAVANVLGDAAKAGDISPQDAQNFTAMTAQDPTKIETAARDLMAKSKVYRPLLDKVEFGKPGEVGFSALTQKPIAGMSVPEKITTEAGLASDANNPNSPTHDNSAQALVDFQRARPLSPEESALKLAQVNEIQAKLDGTIPMSEQQKSEARMQLARLNAEVNHWNDQNAKDKLTKVEHKDPATGRTVIEWLPQSQIAGKTFDKGTNAQTENRLASAQAVNQTGNDIIAKVSDPQYAKSLGVAMGRFSKLQDFIGNPPPEYSELAGQIESYALANMGVHGMRSAQGAEKIAKMLSQPHTPESLIAAIKGLNGFSQHFMENEGRPVPSATQPAVAPSATKRKNPFEK